MTQVASIPASVLYLTPDRPARATRTDQESRASLLKSVLTRIMADAAFRTAIREGGESALRRLAPRLIAHERQQLLQVAADRAIDQIARRG